MRMGKLINISMLCALIIAMFGASANAGQELYFRFYVQDYVSGPNRTVYELAKLDGITSNSPTLFGQVRIVDDLITATPNPNSRRVGRVQGLATFADLENIAPKMDLNIVFTSRFYEGSVLIVCGKHPVSQYARELAIIGGTGRFSTARGKVISTTVSADDDAGYYVLQYSLTVIVDDIGISSKVSNM